MIEKLQTLDIGCGARPRGDINLDVDKKRYWKIWKEMGDHNWILGDAKRLPFRDSCFDCIYCMVSLPYVGNERRAVREMLRVFRPNGRLVITHHLLPFYIRVFFEDSRQRPFVRVKRVLNYPIYRFLEIIIKIFAYMFLDNRQPYWMWKMDSFQTKKGVMNLLKRNGFEVVSMATRKKWFLFDQFIDVEAIKRDEEI